MMQKRIGPASRGDTFGSRRRFPSNVQVERPIEPPKKSPAQSSAPTEAAQPEG